tara:strand:+ start:838 stop:1455 length:618 start_codon:yes stop_codon:yes gene_type:complete
MNQIVFKNEKCEMKRKCAAEDSPPEVGQEDNDVIDMNDCVYFHAEVNNKSIIKLIRALNSATKYALENCYDVKHAYVYVYINSSGGDAFSGLSAMDHIRCNKVPVITIADGFVASAATFMLLGGVERKSMQNAKILIHQLSTTFWGKHADLLDEVHNCKELMETLHSIYVTNTYIKGPQLKSLLKKEIHMNSAQALEYGFVDEIY